MRQTVQPHTYARLLVFNETLPQPHFAVVNRSDAVMSVFYSPFSTRSQNFAVKELLCRSIEFIFLRHPNLKRWWLIVCAMTHKIRGGRAEEYAYYVNKLRQNVGLETWIWRQIMTSQRPHTTNKWPPNATEWTPPWKFSAYATASRQKALVWKS